MNVAFFTGLFISLTIRMIVLLCMGLTGIWSHSASTRLEFISLWPCKTSLGLGCHSLMVGIQPFVPIPFAIPTVLFLLRSPRQLSAACIWAARRSCGGETGAMLSPLGPWGRNWCLTLGHVPLTRSSGVLGPSTASIYWVRLSSKSQGCLFLPKFLPGYLTSN